MLHGFASEILSLCVCLVCIILGFIALQLLRSKPLPHSSAPLVFAPFSESKTFVRGDATIPAENVLVLDCTHSSSLQITHHLKTSLQRRQRFDPNLYGDSTTELVLDALQKHDLKRSFDAVSSNHFDIDSFLSVWSCLHPKLALQHKHTLVLASHLGDFREVPSSDGCDDDLPLAICCWLNTVERSLFCRPFERKLVDEIESDEGNITITKFEHFLPNFEAFLRDPEAFKELWKKEFDNVREGSSKITKVDKYPAISLVVVTAVSPVHYYNLFSSTHGFDFCCSIYPNNAYELETKYTSYISLSSRGCLPRVDMHPLVDALNSIEKQSQEVTTDGKLSWSCCRMTDSGPLLRLDLDGKPLTKAERYGHPFERSIYSSAISPQQFITIVQSFLSFVYKNSENSNLIKTNWLWSDIYQFNNSIDFKQWCCYVTK